MQSIVRTVFAATLAVAVLVPVTAEASGRGHHDRRGRSHHNHGSFLGLNLSWYGPRHHSYYYRPYVAAYPAYRPVVYAEAPYGEIDTDVKPTDCTVYLDGVAIGKAREFDGWPTKLRTTPGRHELMFREPGYEPLQVAVDVLPYHTIQIRERLVPGSDRVGDHGVSAAYERMPVEEPRPSARDANSAIVLSIEPVDASVYLDGKLARAGGEAIGRLLLPVAAGEHRIEVVKPGYRPFTASLVLGDRQRQELMVRLER